MEYFLTGKIVGTHGINGELKVINQSNLNRFFVGSVLYVLKDNKYIKIEIDNVRYHKNFVLIQVNKKTNINDVLEFVGCDIYKKGHEEKLEEGKYYYDELIGLNVYNQDNKEIGKVNDIVEITNGILLEIKQLNSKISLVPYVDAFIKEIDLEKQILIIEEIEGLL